MKKFYHKNALSFATRRHGSCVADFTTETEPETDRIRHLSKCSGL